MGGVYKVSLTPSEISDQLLLLVFNIVISIIYYCGSSHW